MKVGVFIGGQLRRSEEELLTTFRMLEDAFEGCEFVYSLWTDDHAQNKDFVDQHMQNGTIELFEPFDIGYEPYLDNPDAVKNYQYYKKYDDPNPPRHPHQTKQILLHNEKMKKHGDRFDVIVRTRYDATISPIWDFMPYVREVVETPTVVTCMSRTTLKPETMFNVVYRTSNDNYWMPFNKGNTVGPEGWYFIDPRPHCMLADSGLILHRPEDWDSELVDRLHNEKKLLAAEFGWHQILYQGTTHGNYVEYHGGAQLTRCYPKHERDAMKKFMETL